MNRRCTRMQARLAAAALVADVSRSAATTLLRALLSSTVAGGAAAVAAGGGAAFGQLEAERAADRIRLRQAQLEATARLVGLAAVLADQGLARFVVAEIFGAERGDGDEAVAAQP